MNCCIGKKEVSTDDLYTAIAMADRGYVQIQSMRINAEAYEDLMGPRGAIKIIKGDPTEEKKVEITYAQLGMAWDVVMGRFEKRGFKGMIPTPDELAKELGL